MNAFIRVALTIACAMTSSVANSSGFVGTDAELIAGCRGCHGLQGEGNPAAGYPRLAGQDPAYLLKQLNDYIEGTRTNPIMTQIAHATNEQQRASVVASFAKLVSPAANVPASEDPRIVARGRLLAGTGDESKQLQACANCHGPEGRGVPFAAPYLAGQSSSYIATTLGEWKSGKRKNDDGKLMASVAERLDEGDIIAVAAYFERVGPLP